MGWELLNAGMLWGLAGLSLPILAHLLSRKRYDVVPWAAMQFLELEKNARRRVRLEEILLLLLRMALVALLVFSLCRPASSGGWLAGLLDKTRRDVVIVVDGSYSMGWRGGLETPHAAAIQWVHRYLEDLEPGDRVALLDARDQVRDVIAIPTINHDRVRAALNRLPPPAGTADLAEAIRQGVSILRETTNLRRELIVLTDGQAVGWHVDDAVLWERLDDQLAGFPDTTRPRVWVVTPGEPREISAAHYHLDPLVLSRTLVPAGLPVSIRTTLRGQGNSTSTTRRVALEIDGQRLSDRTQSIRVPAGGETAVEFEHRFETAGSHLVAVVLEQDSLPGDDRAESAIESVEALGVLLVDGDPRPDATRGETFFARAALSADANPRPWIAARRVGWDRFSASDLDSVEVVVLANVPRLEPARLGPLIDFVTAGGGLLVTLGDRVDQGAWNGQAAKSGLLPVKLLKIQTEPAAVVGGPQTSVRVADGSLARNWLARFRAERGGGFTEARFALWWSVEPAGGEDPASIVARLTSGDPLLVTGIRGRGRTATFCSSLDADWNTLPARPDYVSFLHELLFRLASGRASRNVVAGEPLLLGVEADFDFAGHAFYGPAATVLDVARAGDPARPLARLADTSLPGHYTLAPRDRRQRVAAAIEHFVVNSDRRESRLDRIDPQARGGLAADGRLRFLGTLEELKETAQSDAPRTELWHVVLLLFLGFLLGEVLLTRRMVQGGYREETEAE